ncbi:MAG: sulfoxide reductase heme-binding subunit YedZ [Proteobacteria bacterium]|nr:MAG: sulfoxide reductase heme-binding subunit YedZ [Pseudomonadota bacterium]
MAIDVVAGRLVEPVEQLTQATGEWSLRLLLATLAVTPLARITGWNRIIRLRRMLGLFSFSYMLMHFSIYLALDRSFYWPEIVTDLTERPYIIAGFACFVLCAPLAATSTDRMIRRLGGRAWKRLHRLVYPASIAAALHFLWLVKADITEPAIYALILSALLGWRLRASGARGAHRPKTNSTPVMGPS